MYIPKISYFELINFYHNNLKINLIEFKNKCENLLLDNPINQLSNTTITYILKAITFL